MATPRKRVTRRKTSAVARGIAEGYRSGLEDALADQLRQAGVPAEYESIELRYTLDPKKYTPDFVLPNGIVIESKGRFVSADRTKHKKVKEQNPDIDIRFVFSRSASKIGKKSDTTYADWCRRNGFQFADRSIPTQWLREPPNQKSLAAIAQLRRKK